MHMTATDSPGSIYSKISTMVKQNRNLLGGFSQPEDLNVYVESAAQFFRGLGQTL